MKIALVANGAWDAAWGKAELVRADLVICADGGANHAMASGCLPDVLIGDLDSVSAENLAACRTAGAEIHVYPSEKDETDLELAFHYIEENLGTWTKQNKEQTPEIGLYGALGGRTDHLLGNFALMLALAQRGITVKADDKEQTVWISGGREIIKGKPGQELSLIPCSESVVVSTAGLYYPLRGEALYQNSPRGISNKLTTETAEIDVSAGWLLIVLRT